MLRLAVRVRREHAEIVLAELLELAPSGVEEVALGEIVEYAVYGASGELPSLPDVRAAAAGALVEVSTSEIPDDWPERWREFHVPLVLGDALTVRPPWEPPATTPIDVVIDPGQAFGTGAHATTRMCLELMLTLEPTGSFLDAGCGSGVLAIAAVKLGFSPVVALDNDPLALQATRVNARGNGVTLDVVRADVRSELLPAAHTVVANILAPALRKWARRLRDTSAEHRPQQLILSGLLLEEADALSAELAVAGLGERDRRTSGDWAALLMGTR